MTRKYSRHTRLFLVIGWIILLAAQAFAQGSDARTLLRLGFNNSLNGEAGETPTTATGTAFVTGVSAQGLSLPANNQLFYPSASNINATEGTVECWIKPDWNGNDGQSHWILKYGAVGGMLLGKDGVNNLRILFNRLGSAQIGETGMGISISNWQANQWHHIAFTWSNTSKVIKLYVDGSQVAQVTFTVQLFPISSTTLQIGGDTTVGYLNATIDELKISDIERTAAEIAENFGTGANKPFNYYGKSIDTFRLFGQRKVEETGRNLVTANGLFHGSGVVVDRSSNPNVVYVADTGNNRILGFKLNCPNGTTCQLDPAKPADLIIGQPDAFSSTCNGDSNLGFNKKPTAGSLCLTGYPQANNVAENWMRMNLEVDSQGNLYVPDIWNNRLLKYNQPMSNDKSNGNGDAIADLVWGQDDFTNNGRNQINNYGATVKPSNRSLWISSGPPDHVSARGVSVDAQGNTWAADTFNNRILRFAPNSKTADLVLGQTNFTSSGCRTSGALNELCTPTLAKVHPVTGDLYVLDEYPAPFRTRLLVFKAPFVNGMSAYKVITPKQDRPFSNWSGWDGTGAYRFQCTGFIFNTYKQGEYASGEIWLNEHQAYRSLLIDGDGNIVKTIGARDNYSIGGDRAYNGVFSACGWIDTGNKLWWPGGSIGMDSANNLYFADEAFKRVYRYSLPYLIESRSGTTCLPEANGALLPKGPNKQSNDRLGEAVGMAVANGQLLVLDEGKRLKIYNQYQSKLFGAEPDFVITGGLAARSLISDSIDDANRLWLRGEHGLRIYQLPITSNNQAPLADLVKLYWADTGEEITQTIVNCLAFDKINKVMYLVEERGTRILRIKNYNQFQNKLFVDMVLGQRDKTSVTCNQGLSTPNAETLCTVTQIKFDRLGNLFAVDNAYECHGNARIVMYAAADLRNTTTSTNVLFPSLPARKVFIANSFFEKGACAYSTTGYPGSPVSIAFNQRNEMVVGNDGYYGNLSERQLKQLWIYKDPLNRATPDASIDIYMGTPGEIAFDESDNLLIQDHTWYKVMMINLNQDTEWLSPLVKQGGCDYSLTATNLNFPSSGGTANINITANSACAWNSSSNASWLSVTSSPAGNGTGNLTFSVLPGNGSPRSGQLTIAGYTFTINQAVNNFTVASVSSASYLDLPMAPSSIASAFGMQLSFQTAGTTQLPLPTVLGGTSVKVKDQLGVERQASLFYVSPTQINYQIPPDTAPGFAAVTITNSANVVSFGGLQISSVAPGIFSASSDGAGLAAAQAVRVKPNNVQTYEEIARYDSTLSKFVAIPVNLDITTDSVYLLLYGTGIRFRSTLANVQVTIGGQVCRVDYAGLQGFYIGVDQLNVLLPQSLRGRGDADVVITVDGKVANTVKVNIK